MEQNEITALHQRFFPGAKIEVVASSDGYVLISECWSWRIRARYYSAKFQHHEPGTCELQLHAVRVASGNADLTGSGAQLWCQEAKDLTELEAAYTTLRENLVGMAEAMTRILALE
jgi:hypothetical protein